MKIITIAASFFLASTFSSALWAQNVEVKDAWARATVQGQKASGAFMQLTAKSGSKLVGVSSPVAGVAEVHEMKMDGDVMKMRAVDGGLDLPAGKAVELKPGGYHLMLMDLKVALLKDTTIPLTLVFKDAKGVESKTELNVPVSLSPPAGQAEHAAHATMEAPKGTDAQQIAGAMKKQFERPDAPLAVAPVTVVGDYAVAGWIQGKKGGRALLQKDHGQWVFSVCAGNGLTQAKVLETTGMNAAQATKLAQAVTSAEARLSANQRKLFDSFEGMVKIDGAQEAHGMHRHPTQSPSAGH
jgi:hypothetical protein